VRLTRIKKTHEGEGRAFVAWRAPASVSYPFSAGLGQGRFPYLREGAEQFRQATAKFDIGDDAWLTDNDGINRKLKITARKQDSVSAGWVYQLEDTTRVSYNQSEWVKQKDLKQSDSDL